MLLAKQDGNVAEWLRRGLQILVSRFDSGRCLQKNLVLVIKKSELRFLYSSVAQLVEKLTVKSARVVESRSTTLRTHFIEKSILLNFRC